MGLDVNAGESECLETRRLRTMTYDHTVNHLFDGLFDSCERIMNKRISHQQNSKLKFTCRFSQKARRKFASKPLVCGTMKWKF